ncbi:MAG: helix-turn-helix transcriptional regulator [Dehalococcoidia bacterium]|nr:helix-turn-helix transcriptional regulator [Dehalococcoidia bacterium]
MSRQPSLMRANSSQGAVGERSNPVGHRLAEELLKLRLRARLSQRALGRIAGLSWTYIQHLERGHRDGKPIFPSPQVLRRIARGLAADPIDESLIDRQVEREVYERLMRAAGYVEAETVKDASTPGADASGESTGSTATERGVADGSTSPLHRLVEAVARSSAPSSGLLLHLANGALAAVAGDDEAALLRAVAVLQRRAALYLGPGHRADSDGRLRQAAVVAGLQIVAECADRDDDEHVPFAERPGGRRIFAEADRGLFASLVVAGVNDLGCSEARVRQVMLDLGQRGVSVQAIRDADG